MPRRRDAVEAAARVISPRSARVTSRAGDKVEVHTHGVWRKGSVRKVNYGRLCPGRPPDVRYDVHLESEGAWLPDELDHLRRVFKRVDEDGSGEIDRDELQKLLIELEHPLALDDYCVDDLFRRTDKDGSGHIDFPEFCDLVYVELHDDIGLPHTLYNVGRGVLPSILRRRRRGPAPSPRRFQQHRSPTASSGGSPGSSASPKISSRRNGDP